MQDCLQSIGHRLVPKQAGTDRLKAKHTDMVATAPLRPRPTECETTARPHQKSCIKITAVEKIMAEEWMHTKLLSTTNVLTANYMHGTRQPAQILLN
jgi:hypothetical protein